VFAAVVSIVLLLLSALIVVMNWYCVITNARNSRKGIEGRHSMVPLASVILAGFFAYSMYPFTPKGWILIIPAVDIGNWAVLLLIPIALFKGIFRKKPSNEGDD
jgi:hypothetical protein